MAVKENPVKACFPLLALVALAAGPALAQSSVSLSGLPAGGRSRGLEFGVRHHF